MNRKGFALNAFVDEQKLGLKRLVVFTDLDEKYWSFSRDIFQVLYSYMGLCYYARVLPSGMFVVHCLVPTSYEQELVQALKELKDQGSSDDWSSLQCSGSVSYA